MYKTLEQIRALLNTAKSAEIEDFQTLRKIESSFWGGEEKNLLTDLPRDFYNIIWDSEMMFKTHDSAGDEQTYVNYTIYLMLERLEEEMR